MNKKISRGLSFLLAAVISICGIIIAGAESGSGFDYLSYPDEAVTAFRSDIPDRISSGDDYISNQGYNETGLYISPYWTLEINREKVPVYATAVYDYKLNRGVVQSFQYIYVDSGEFMLNITMSCPERIRDISVLPESLGCSAKSSKNNAQTCIKKTGTYTFLINNDSQEYALTLFVQRNKNENEEIEGYKERYGAENVAVYEKGVYCLDNIPADKKVIYFRRGSYISANHLADIRTAEDAQKHTAAPFMELNSKNGTVVTGCGTFDFTKIDRQERTLININFCQNTTVENLIIINPNSWTVTAYGSENCEMKNITVFGYRTNSDGINICGCNNMKISGCFCRNGDDCFSAKATNTNFECHDIEFSGCIGWSNKARCFGITGEVERDIYNISFKDCAVIYRNATWDNDRVASLAIAVETGSGSVHDVAFENIEIHRDEGRAVYCMVYGENITGCTIGNVTFRNIKYSAEEKIKISSERTISRSGIFSSGLVRFLKRIRLDNLFENLIKRLEKNYESSNSVDVKFENVFSKNTRLKKINQNRFFTVQGNSQIMY